MKNYENFAIKKKEKRKFFFFFILQENIFIEKKIKPAKFWEKNKTNMQKSMKSIKTLWEFKT